MEDALSFGPAFLCDRDDGYCSRLETIGFGASLMLLAMTENQDV
jgi:hypothetical protein